MTDDGPKITSEVKVKNPKRVEAGKKLAALSKVAREKKKLDQSKTNDDGPGSNVKYIIGVAGLLVAVGLLYFTYRSYSKESSTTVAEPVKVVTNEPKTVSLESL